MSNAQVSPKKVGILVGAIAALILTVSLAGQILETNNEGYYQVKQAALSGEMSVRNTAGTYNQFFANITTYQVSDMLYFSKDERDGAATDEAISVRFNDGGTARVSGSLKFRLSTKDADQLTLHKEFKSYERVKHDLIRQAVTEALTKTAALMKAEESYSTRLAEFTSLVEDQIRYGIYETISKQVAEKDADGNVQYESRVEIKHDAEGKRILYKQSPFIRYNVEIVNFLIKDFDFDEKTQAIIVAKKEAEQAKVVAKANAERAKQDAITTKEQGSARVAKAEADALVEKKTAVINAERETEVARQEKLKAAEVAQATLNTGRAEAEANRLKVSAGLTPQERAEYRMKTAIGVAEKLSQVQLPTMMVMGGDSKGGATDPFTAVGLESFMRINEKLAGQKANKASDDE
jgi:regulator of protease activity HflC (stomatin/prohibitin superfamily)